MEITALAAAIVAALTPFLAKAGEEFAKEAGKAAVDRISELYTLLQKRFQKKPAAAEALQDMHDKPQDPDTQAALRKQLVKQIETDPELKNVLLATIQQIKQDPQAATFVTQVFGGEVGKIINIGSADKVDID
jgi:hypothetical protein